ncbi:MAG TPA: general secretion pathway protein GspB [Dissulfurispiraceae bacterium]
MSYILDALKKSEQRRRHGTVPDLLTAQDIAAARPGKRSVWLSLLVAVLAVNAGLLLWWLHPWRHAKPVMTAKAPVRQETVAPAPVAVPPPAVQAAPQQPVKKTEPVSERRKPRNPEAQKQTASQGFPPETGALPAKQAGPSRKTPDVGELPPAMQQELASLTISGHFYSARPDQRLVSVNGKIMREGQTTGTGLKLERITPDGVVFSYQGYRFSKGIF